jgi:hypothetical protein
MLKEFNTVECCHEGNLARCNSLPLARAEHAKTSCVSLHYTRRENVGVDKTITLGML